MVPSLPGQGQRESTKSTKDFHYHCGDYNKMVLEYEEKGERGMKTLHVNKYPDDYINKIICGDCLEVMKGIADKSVDLILTDIPYNEVNRRSNGLRNLNKGAADSSVFDMDVLLMELNRTCLGSIYIFCGTEQVSRIRHSFVEMGLSTRHCIWEKSNPSPMNGEYIWLSSIENCVYAKNKCATFNERCKGAVWKYPVQAKQQHPTQKPTKLFEYLVHVSSKEGDTVLDPFMGSGTTAVACKELGRNFIGIEKEPKYCAIAEERLRILDMQPKLLQEEPK